MSPDAVQQPPEAHDEVTVRPADGAAAGSGPTCCCATSIGQVEAAWGLVYERYTHMGLIDPNPYRVHASPNSIGAHACVVWGPEGPVVGFTMTLFRDNSMGLPLDGVYPRELDELRRRGRSMLEVGMLADRRRYAARSTKALINMLRWSLHYALYCGLTDLVIGVHPRHALFYARYYGFEVFGSETNYPMVRNHLVVPMRLRIPEGLANPGMPRGLAHAYHHRVPDGAFDRRFAFEPRILRGSRIAGFMRERYGIDACDVTTHPIPLAPNPHVAATGQPLIPLATRRLD